MEKRAVIYARYSCEKQTEQSIEGQIRVCKEFAERNGYTVIHHYIDRAVSGRTDHREEFQRMLKDSERHFFSYVIVYKLDRFSRNRLDSAINKAVLKKNGVKLLSALEQITDSPEGIILESMIEGYAEYYSAELSQKVKRGMRESCLKGNAAGIQPIFGYCIVDKKYQIVDAEANIVRKLFHDYVNGSNIKDLVAWLKDNGIRSHRGAVFSFGRVSEMLRNKKYIGLCSYSGEVYDNIIPAIIDQETFNRAQIKLSENVHKSGRERAGEKFILSGKLICADCGALMIGESGTCRNGEIHYFYKCGRKKKNSKNCNSHAVRKNIIEEHVFKEIVRTMQDESFLKRVAKQAVEVHNKEIKESRELKIKTKQLSEVERKLNNITEAICNGIFNSMTQAKMVELTELKDKLAVEIQEEETKTIQPIQEEKVLKFLKNYSRLVKCVEKEDSLKNKKALFDMFIKEVIFDGERCLIVMKTAEEDVNTEKKEKSRTIHDFFRERFETLPFGDPFEVKGELFSCSNVTVSACPL